MSSRSRTVHSPMELFKWTFTQAAVAPCFVKDVFEMEAADDSYEFFWLGRVPCRTVKVVGMVVGVDQFDDMTRYKVDDGTAVIDCECKHPIQPKPPSTVTSKHSKPASKYKLPEEPKPPPSKGKFKSNMHLTLPTASTGASICVQGRIVRGRGSRFLRVEAGSFAVCKSANDEPQHWLDVLRLHRESYSLAETFIIPAVERQPEPAPSITETSALLPPSSPVTASSPSKTDSSPVRPSTSTHQPRLRHPSRLRSRDLTDVTFRIYFKHYVDFAPPYRPSRYLIPHGILTEDDEDDQSSGYVSRCTTPTPASRHQAHGAVSLSTPRPRTLTEPQYDKNLTEYEEPQYGFTLSYLRRVPVLAEMARGVVRAEQKRREKDARKREKEKSSESQPSSSKTQSRMSVLASAPGKGKTPSTDSTARKMKRLYRKTIRDLYSEGSIVLWDGPHRPCSQASFENDNDNDFDGPSCLWKTSTSTSSGAGAFSLGSSNNTATNAGTGRTKDGGYDSAAELSEPDPQEEAYLPVTTATMSVLLLRTIREMTAPRPPPEIQAKLQSRISNAECPASTSSTSTAVRPPTSRRRRPPTADEILAYLRASDARWANLGSWVIDDALEKLREEERVFKAGQGRWALCI